MSSIITRKVQLNFRPEKKEERKKYWEIFNKWEDIAFRAANIVATHQFFLEAQSQFHYLKDEPYNLSSKDSEKYGKGKLTTSRRNTSYQVLSNEFKGEIPTNILSCINNDVYKNIQAERKDYLSGKRSLRQYKKGYPIPFSSQSIRNLRLVKNEYLNYEFDLFKLPLVTYFGRDLSNNKSFFDKVISGEYKLKESSLINRGTKLFGLFAFEIPKKEFKPDKDNSIDVRLGLDNPIIIVQSGKRNYYIGTKKEFLYNRISIQEGRKRIQKGAKYNSGGRGRKKKLSVLERFKRKEINYVNQKLHSYTREVINYCIKNNIGKIIIDTQKELMVSLEEKIKEIKKSDLSYHEKEKEIERQKFVLRNWSFYGLKEKLSYKAEINNIDIVVK